MIDWEDIAKIENADELEAAKVLLFQENLRLLNERKDIEQDRAQLEDSMNEFYRERARFRQEMEELDRRTQQERKTLHEENLFFEKKMAILKDGFRSLEEDRRNVEREKKQLEEERKRLTSGRGSFGSDIGDILFRSADSPLGLRKRYRDLIKIFHPDNLFGDDELSQIINEEFQKRNQDEEEC